ncbi:MAG: transporter substrate-binding protein [Spirochaetia bacterium]|nr:transporter substrate-binding protein [Spirochaetia bacterium]
MEEKTIKLGLMPPLTGLVGIYGQEISRAGQIACKEINEAGGILGKKLELIIEDDGSLPESSVEAAEKLIDVHQCSAIIGNLLSNSRIAVAYRVAEPRKIPYLNFSFYEGSIQSRYFFHFAALPNQQIEKMIPYMFHKYGRRMFFAGNNYEWPRGSIHSAMRILKSLGGEVLGERYCPIGADLEIIENILDEVEKLKPDVFVPYFAGTDQVNLLTRFTERGLKKYTAVVMGHYDEMMASKLSPEVRNGFYSSNTYFMTVDTEENHKYLDELSKLPDANGVWPDGNGILTNFGEGTYVCVKAFAEAANRAGTVEPEAIVEALKNISIKAPQGIVQMNPESHHATVNTYLSQCGEDGIFKVVENFGSIPPILPDRYNHQRIIHQATLEDDIRLQARMLEQMTEGILLVSSSDHSIVYANAGAEKLFGYPKDLLISMPFQKVNDAEGIPKQSLKSDEIIQKLNQKGFFEGTVQTRKNGGADLYCSVSISTFTHPIFGEVWLSVYRDTTRIMQLQNELEKHKANLEKTVEERTEDLRIAKEEAEEANQAKSVFLSRMSHELRTPMNAIIGFSQMLEREDLNESQFMYVDEITRAGDHMLGLIDDLLELSRIEAGKVKTTIETIRVYDSLHEALEFVRGPIISKKISLINQCREDSLVLADSTRLRQILINLLTNAVKYNRENGKIELTCTAVNGNKFRINVSDTGYGIPDDQIGKLFQPFERLGAEQSDIAGSGIGLALARQLAELMHGSMGAVSNPKSGSTFWVELPAAS